MPPVTSGAEASSAFRAFAAANSHIEAPRIAFETLFISSVVSAESAAGTKRLAPSSSTSKRPPTSRGDSAQRFGSSGSTPTKPSSVAGVVPGSLFVGGGSANTPGTSVMNTARSGRRNTERCSKMVSPERMAQSCSMSNATSPWRTGTRPLSRQNVTDRNPGSVKGIAMCFPAPRVNQEANGERPTACTPASMSAETTAALSFCTLLRVFATPARRRAVASPSSHAMPSRTPPSATPCSFAWKCPNEPAPWTTTTLRCVRTVSAMDRAAAARTAWPRAPIVSSESFSVMAAPPSFTMTATFSCECAWSGASSSLEEL